MLKDALGDRMKEYEDITRYKLPRKSLVLGRIDGNAFHTYTKGLKRPFDQDLINDMDSTAIYLCQELQNVKFAFVQSDEISLFMREDGRDTQSWFNNVLQKMGSIGASKATTEFNRRRLMRDMELIFKASIKTISDNEFSIVQRGQNIIENFKMAEFDARFWTVPSAIEVYNYFLWRQRDAEKNSISAAAQSLYSHKELEGKNGLVKQEMMWQKGVNWNDYPAGQKRGRFIEKRTYLNNRPVCLWKNEDDTKQFYFLDGPTPMNDTFEKDVWVASDYPTTKDGDIVRTNWEVVESPIFSQDVDFLLNRIKLPENA